MSRSVRQAAENEASFRRANEGLEEKADESALAMSALPTSVSARTSVADASMSLRREEYEAVRAPPSAS